MLHFCSNSSETCTFFQPSREGRNSSHLRCQLQVFAENFCFWVTLDSCFRPLSRNSSHPLLFFDLSTPPFPISTADTSWCLNSSDLESCSSNPDLSSRCWHWTTTTDAFRPLSKPAYALSAIVSQATRDHYESIIVSRLSMKSIIDHMLNF